jgi:hypothetical protein
MLRGNRLLSPSKTAPIWLSGSATLSIGRFCKDWSPLTIAEKACPAKTPSNSLAVVPELPASKTERGSSRRIFLPSISRRLLLSVIETPKLRRQLIVERQSSASKKPLTSVMPRAKAPIMAARWVIDLSPGTDSSPHSFFGRLVIIIINWLLTVHHLDLWYNNKTVLPIRASFLN